MIKAKVTTTEAGEDIEKSDEDGSDEPEDN